MTGISDMGFFESIMPSVAGAGSVALGTAMASNLGQTGAEAQTQMGTLAGQLAEDTKFNGYGVTTGHGTASVNADGSTDFGVDKNTDMLNAADTQFGSAATNMANAALAAQGGNPAYNQAMTGLQANANNGAYGDAMSAQQAGMNGLAGQQSGMLNASQQAMTNAMGDRAGREQEIYNSAMAMQQPGLDQARASQQSQEFAQGRSGVRGSQFGGTAEDAAMAKAQAGAQNQAAFQAMSQGQQEMMNQAQMSGMFGQQGMSAAGMQGQLGSQMGQLGAQNAQLGQAAAGAMGQLGQGQGQLNQSGASLLNQIGQSQANQANMQYQNSFMPLNQQMQAMQIAQGNAGMSQSGAFTGAGYGAQLGLGGIQADINAQKAATELYGNMFDSIMDNSGAMGKGLDNLWDKYSPF